MLARRRLALILAVALACLAGASHATASLGYKVIVNPSNPQTAIDRRQLADAFLKKVTRWGTGETIRPVDQRGENPARQRFSDEVLGRSVAAVKSYWAQLVFSGRDLPPPELEGDAEVVRYVLKHPGAIGYVSSTANVEGAKALVVR